MKVEKITDYLTVDMISLDLKSKNKRDILLELSKLLGTSDGIEDYKIIDKALIQREELGTTGIGKGVAIPHAKTDYAKHLTIGFGRSNEGVKFDSLDGNNVNLFFVFVSPLSDSAIYLKILARVSRLIRDVKFRAKLLEAHSPQEVVDIISSEER